MLPVSNADTQKLTAWSSLLMALMTGGLDGGGLRLSMRIREYHCEGWRGAMEVQREESVFQD